MKTEKRILSFSLSLFLFLSITFVENNHAQILYVDKTTDVAKQYTELSRSEKRQVDCLTDNVYHESGAEGYNGWLAVAMVTMNRVHSGKFPDNVCGVVYQRTGNFYQFSWVGNKKRLTKPEELLYNKIQQLSFNVYMDYKIIHDITKGALFFHADHVNPQWNRQRTAKIGRHIFYR
jgi:spore germination cell wall hydrolase CwlJ-like protein